MPDWVKDAIIIMHYSKITVTDLAKHLNKSRGYISMLLNGKKTSKKAEQMIMNALDELKSNEQKNE